MENKFSYLSVLTLLFCYSVVAMSSVSSGYNGPTLGHHKKGSDKCFLLQKSKHVIKTEAGDMRIVRGFGGKFMANPMHIGFISMEPKSLFIPQYLDSSLILFISTGEARVGHIHKDELVEKDLKSGDIYRIAPGSAFYLINTSKRKKLQVISSIDSTETLGLNIQSFFLAGGTYPVSVLSGFDESTLSVAFNVSQSQLQKLLSKQQNGPIVFLSDSHSALASNVWSKFIDMDQHKKLSHMKRIASIWGKDDDNVDEKKEEELPTLFFRKFLMSMLGKDSEMRSKSSESPESFNIYGAKPDFKNDYGWNVALDESKYSPLEHDDIGIYLVNLKPGSMMAPHVNPKATEYGIVLKGTGTIQIVYPNGTLAMKAKVSEGDIFWVPRYFPFCQIASRDAPFKFFGFTTSARNNKAQFLVGANSLLHTMEGSEFSTAFRVSKDKFKSIINAQQESVILPSPAHVKHRSTDDMEYMLINDIGY